MASYASLFVGDPVPWFRQRCTTAHGDYTFDMTGGRYVVFYLFVSSSDPRTEKALATIRAHRRLFDDRQASFFGVSADPMDEERLQAELPGIRHFLDQDGLVGRLLGARPVDGGGETRNLWYVLDPLLRVRAVSSDEPETAGGVVELLGRLPSLDQAAADLPTPALMLSDVFEPEFCSRLMTYYDRSESRPSGVFTQTGDGPSRAVSDSGFKRRRDCSVRDRTLVEQIQARIIRRVVPEIRKVYQFEATELERLILASYDSSDRGCFGAHRDNTVTATAHRRFAVSINLNDRFEGGELVFPEFSRRRYRPAAGGAIIFSCSLMHLVTPVTAGRRLACLPFVYDEAAARLKRANAAAAAPPQVLPGMEAACSP
jgi:predicted 2-oxoglutarate/Fe(II)-dependent dioxygenase YbiX/peroxiredoxin